MWTARARNNSLTLLDPIQFTDATLVESYPQPDMLSLSGDLEELRPAIKPGYGIMLTDDTGALRFNGFLTSAERLGNGTANLIFAHDDTNLWQRIVWPVHNAPWTAQTSAYDVQTGPAETRLLTYINRNMGPISYTPSPFSVTTTRQVLHTRFPTSQSRGPSAKTSARFNVLGELVSQLAESAGLRVKIILTYEGTEPHLDVTVTEVPDLTAWARFGTPEASGPGLLGGDWRYQFGIPSATSVLCAASGEKEARILRELSDLDRNSLWGRRIESFLDQRQTDDSTEINQAMVDAMAEAAGLAKVSAPLGESDLNVGGTGGATGVDVPLGAKVTAVLDGELIQERIRQITTTISAQPGQETVKVEPVIGTPNAGLATPTQRKLAAALRRVSLIERNQ